MNEDKHLPLAFLRPDPAIHIRPVLKSDVEALATYCWPERPLESVYSLVKAAQSLAHNGRGMGVVIADAGDVAFAYGQLTLWPSCAEISDLIVNEVSRSQGYGTAMIQYLVRAARAMHSPCVEIGAARSNPRAWALYRRLGFVEQREIMLNLGDGDEPVIFLRLELEFGQ